MGRGEVWLASRRLPGFDGGGRDTAVVAAAAEPLPDRDAIVRDLLADLAAAGCAPRLVDLRDPDAFSAPIVAVGGGDPYHLLARLRETGADARLRDAVASGVTYVGISAGAIVAGPSLVPQTRVSPFPPPADLDLRGLGLVDVVVFPHPHRPGRAARIAAARAELGDRYAMVALSDDAILRR